MDVAIVGGTGAEGRGIALRLASAGHRVVIGSRDVARAAESAASVGATVGRGDAATGLANDAAAAAADVVFLTVPFVAQAEICRAIAPSRRDGAIVCDATSPLATAIGGKPWETLRPWHGSAAEQAAALLGERVRVVAAFHTIAAGALAALDTPIDSDVLVCGDDADAKAVVGGLIDAIAGLRWVDCGTLAQARIAEQLTALLISVNRAYRVHGAGFRVTGRDTWGRPGA
ncbi:MAG: NADPH-dependent F420 reductase [Actinomycetota bacterium]